MNINCPKCHSNNTDTARFCSNCATQLAPGAQPPPARMETLGSPTYVLTPLLNSPANEQWPDISPDGRWIAYSSDESRRFEVCIRPFPGLGLKYQLSSEGGSEPLWARDGRRIFYRWGDEMWVVDVRTEGGFFAGKPRLLFEKPGYGGGAPMRTYDLSLDSQSFLMVKLEQRKPAPVTEMILVQNWFGELKRLVPRGKN